MEVKTNKLECSLPKFHQIESWNKTINPERMYLVNTDLTQATVYMKISTLHSYYKNCILKKCFSCERQKTLDDIALRG